MSDVAIATLLCLLMASMVIPAGSWVVRSVLAQGAKLDKHSDQISELRSDGRELRSTVRKIETTLAKLDEGVEWIKQAFEQRFGR